jgi:tetratricopeptide (TPR) repeat protein
MNRLVAFGGLVFALLTLSVWTVQASEEKKEAIRFDHEVREDIFAGFGGDKEALERGIKKCEVVLEKNPKHAEALVWRGAARVFQAGQLFQAKKQAEGLKLWNSGLKDLDDALELDPKNVGVRIPRAAILVQSGHNAPPQIGKPLLEKARKDFETIFEAQKKHLDKIGRHPHGELRMGLADVYRALGEADKSKEQLEAVVKELPKTKYADRAQEWLAAKADAKLIHNCIGCHVPNEK